jgi:hypothetical protein
MQNPEMFAQAVRAVPGYPSSYSFERTAHVRLEKLPLEGMGLRFALDSIYPAWEEAIDWGLLLERESFLLLTVSAIATLSFLLLRFLLAWYADRQLRVPRFHLRQSISRAGAVLLSAPEIKQ